MMKRYLSFAVIMGLFCIAVFSVISSPHFASWENKEIAYFYMDNALSDTGASNIVSAIVWDFRGFDTLGEETVLFTSLVGVFTVLAMKKR